MVIVPVPWLTESSLPPLSVPPEPVNVPALDKLSPPVAVTAKLIPMLPDPVAFIVSDWPE